MGSVRTPSTFNAPSRTTVVSCGASGNVSVTADNGGTAGMDNLYMIYVGGLAGYAGQSLTERSSASGSVYAKSPYPYAGGLVGYHYKGNITRESFATGTVTSVSINNLAYAGGLAGYNSGNNSRIENCYATGDVTARSSGRTAWAGGIVGSNAKDYDVVSRCYATGNIRAETGSGEGDFSGQPGVSAESVAGGIAGNNYYSASAGIENCAALNAGVTGTATTADSSFNIHRVAGNNRDGAYCSNNIANSAMTLTGSGAAIATAPDSNGLDGADCAAQPDRSVYTDLLGWDFATVWKMGGAGYPVLQWQQ